MMKTVPCSVTRCNISIICVYIQKYCVSEAWLLKYRLCLVLFNPFVFVILLYSEEEEGSQRNRKSQIKLQNMLIDIIRKENHIQMQSYTLEQNTSDLVLTNIIVLIIFMLLSIFLGSFLPILTSTKIIFNNELHCTYKTYYTILQKFINVV